MTLTVRLPDRVEQELAEYCLTHGLSKSEAVKQALEELLRTPPDGEAHPFIGCEPGDGSDVSGTIKATLRARFRNSR